MKNRSKPSSAKALSELGKPLYGTAAQLRLTSLAGGWDKHQNQLVTSTVKETVDQLWLKILAHYTLVPSFESQAQKHKARSSEAQAHTCETPRSVNLTPSSSFHGHH